MGIVTGRQQYRGKWPQSPVPCPVCTQAIWQEERVHRHTYRGVQAHMHAHCLVLVEIAEGRLSIPAGTKG